MQLVGSCRRHLAAPRNLCRKQLLHSYYPYKLHVARFAPPPPHSPPSRPRGGFFRRWRRRIVTVAIATGLFGYFMDADTITYGCNLYRRYYDSDGMRDKTVWVVGASSGIGEYLMYDLVKSGASRIIISARRKEQLDRVKAECQRRIQQHNEEQIKSVQSVSSGLSFEQRVAAEIDKLPDDGNKDLDP